MATKSECWACYHSSLYTFQLGDYENGIVPCVVGAPYAVLVAEQLFVSGCKLLISVTSAGIIKQHENTKRFALITSSIRDEGTSYHYLPAAQPALLNRTLFDSLHKGEESFNCPYFEGMSWTTDARYRETASSIESAKQKNVICVEMEASA